MDRQGDTRKNGPHNRDANAAQRAVQAIALRASGMTYADVALQVGFSDASAARKAILRELERTVVQAVNELRTQELDRLERMHKVAWDLMNDPKNKGRLLAIDRLLAIADRRSKLMGLDAVTNNTVANATVIVRETPPGYVEGLK